MAKPKRRKPEPFIDWNRTYTANDLVWTDDGGSWCVVAVCEVGGDTKKGKTARPANGSYT